MRPRTPRLGARTVLAICLAGCAIASGAGQAPLDYTQWRGTRRDGAASSFKAPATWPESLTRRWKATVGEGYGTPLVVGSRVGRLRY